MGIAFPSPYGDIFLKYFGYADVFGAFRAFPSPYGDIFLKFMSITGISPTKTAFPSPYGDIFLKFGRTDVYHAGYGVAFSVPLRGYFFEIRSRINPTRENENFSVPLRGYFFEIPRRMSS